jgi:hypothetical protein
MNKLVLLVLLSVIFAARLSASTIIATCTGGSGPAPNEDTFAGGSGSGPTISCQSWNAIAPAGSTFVNAQLVYNADMVVNSTIPISADSVTLTFTAGNGFSPDPATINITNPPGQTNPKTCTPPGCSVTSTSTTVNLAAVVNVLLASGVNSGTSVQSSNGSVQLVYNYTPAVTGTTPEPVTMSLIGLGLLYLGLAARRK